MVLQCDHLGSTSLTTDKNGVKTSEMRYKPWGEVRSWWTSALATTPAYKLADYTFTGQYSYTTDFGLMFYNARFYDPALGRFTSADTIIPSGVQGYDRFAYSNNNPIKYVDPDGHNPILIAIIAMSMFMLAGDTSRPVNEVASSSAPNITAEDIVDGIANVYELGVILSVGGPESAAEVFQDEVLDNLEFANTELKDSLSLGAGQIPVPGVDFVLDKLINDPAGTEQFQEAIDDLISQEYLDANNNGALHVTYDGASYTTFDIGVDNLVTVNTIEFGTLNICGETSSVCNKISLSQNDAMITRKWLSNFNQEME